MGEKKINKFTVSMPIGITWTDYPDPIEHAVIVYFSGCFHDCRGCQNPELQNYSFGDEFSLEELESMIVNECNSTHTDKVVFSGGDCLYQDLSLLNRLIKDLNSTGISVCVYTGFSIEYIKKHISGAAFYKCGKYDERMKEKEG